jgi:hypothetical protein
VELDVRRVYYPFVRLALARFQPISVPGAHLSRVVLSDFVQVAPPRRVDYDLGAIVAGGTVPLRVSGPSYLTLGRLGSGTSVMLARLERRQHGDSQSEDEVGWEAIQTVPLAFSHQGNFEMRWEGAVALPDPLPHPLRIVVLEAELYQTDGRPAGDILNLLQQEQVHAGTLTHSGAMLERNLGYRIVFADATVITV